MKRGRKAKPHEIIDGVECKWCSGCSQWKSLDAFPPRPKKWDGLSTRCIECGYLHGKAVRERHKATGHVAGMRIPPGTKFLRVAMVKGKKTWTKLYGVWGSMRKRCTCPTVKDYPRYGARGITVCKEWLDSYDAFREWALSSGYRKGLTIDRKDSDGNYTPENCRWIPKGEQQENVRTAIKITHNGVTRSLYRWARVLGVSADVLRGRVYAGWSDEHVVTIPLGALRPGRLRGRAAAKAKRLALMSSEGHRIMTNNELAEKLARSIFEAPIGRRNYRDKVRRIQFKGGEYGAETDLGGFNEHALAGHIAVTLDDLGITPRSGDV